MYHSVLMGSLGEGLCLSDKHWPSLVLSNERGQLVGLEHLISRPTGARVELLGWGFSNSNSHCKDIIIVFNDTLERDLFLSASPELLSLSRAVMSATSMELKVSKSSYSIVCSQLEPITKGNFYSPLVASSNLRSKVEEKVKQLLWTQDFASVKAALGVVRQTLEEERKHGCVWSKNRVKMGNCFSHASLGSLVEKVSALLSGCGWFPEAMSILKEGIEFLRDCDAPSTKLALAKLQWCRWTLVLQHHTDNDQMQALDEHSKELVAYGTVASEPEDRINAAAHHLHFGRWCAFVEVPGLAKMGAFHLDKAVITGTQKNIKDDARYIVNAAVRVLVTAPRLRPFVEFGLSRAVTDLEVRDEPTKGRSSEETSTCVKQGGGIPRKSEGNSSKACAKGKQAAGTRGGKGNLGGKLDVVRVRCSAPGCSYDAAASGNHEPVTSEYLGKSREKRGEGLSDEFGILDPNRSGDVRVSHPQAQRLSKKERKRLRNRGSDGFR